MMPHAHSAYFVGPVAAHGVLPAAGAGAAWAADKAEEALFLLYGSFFVDREPSEDQRQGCICTPCAQAMCTTKNGQPYEWLTR